jgi:hypothetical protein
MATSGSEDDFIYKVWRKPNWAAEARSGRVSPERAALFMAIHANVAPRPAPIAVQGMPEDVWPTLWRHSISVLRAMWETGACETMDEIRAIHDEAMRREVKGTGLEAVAPMASGRAAKGAVSHGLDLHPALAVRARWMPRLGWPADKRLKDDDAYGVAYSRRGTEGWHQPVRIDGRIMMPIGSGAHHETEADAEAELRPLLEKLLTERAADEGLGVSGKALGRGGVRVGPPNTRRLNRRATTQDLIEVVGMRGLEFGQWINQKERQEVLDQAFDAFFDLCTVLRLPARGGSLWGRAGLAFGSRGMGPGVSGHFEPGSWVVHMDRQAGSGVLAHEMGHAIDAVLAEACGLGRGSFLSAGVWAGWRDHSVARMMVELIDSMRKDRTGEQTQFLKDAISYDRSQGRRIYWSEPLEMFARVFECWVHDSLAKRRRRNDFLVARHAGEDVTGLEWRALASPYPKGAERRRMIETMDEFLKVAMPMAQARLDGRDRLRG